MFSVIACIRDDHDWRLVLVAAVVCLAGCVATMLLLLRAQRSEGSQRGLWTAVSGFACGIGVWSTHFIAMLAYDGGMTVSYGAWRDDAFRSFSRSRPPGLLSRSGLALARTTPLHLAVSSWAAALPPCTLPACRRSRCRDTSSYDARFTVFGIVAGTLLAMAALHAFHVLRNARRLVVSIAAARRCHLRPALHLDERHHAGTGAGYSGSRHSSIRPGLPAGSLLPRPC